MIELETLQPQHIPFGMQLKSAAGWNQLAADWELLLALNQVGSYLASWQGQPAGTVTTITHDQQSSWIGMVLVDPNFRGRGIGTRLLKAAIEQAERLGPVWLDATPKGRKLYLTLGFRDICPLERMEAHRLVFPSPTEEADVQPLTKDLLPACLDYDTRHYGPRRDPLLTAFWRRAPAYAFVARRGKHIAGYCLGRSGSQFEQIGPLIACDVGIARALLLAAARNLCSKPVIVDIMSGQQAWRDYLLTLGFSTQRPFIRMCRGVPSSLYSPDGHFAIAGPEFG